jgi:hypothetical protein
MCEIGIGIVGLVSIVSLIAFMMLKDELLDLFWPDGLDPTARGRRDRRLIGTALVAWFALMVAMGWGFSSVCGT